jgi:hypothetical protein
MSRLCASKVCTGLHREVTSANNHVAPLHQLHSTVVNPNLVIIQTGGVVFASTNAEVSYADVNWTCSNKFPMYPNIRQFGPQSLIQTQVRNPCLPEPKCTPPEGPAVHSFTLYNKPVPTLVSGSCHIIDDEMGPPIVPDQYLVAYY